MHCPNCAFDNPPGTRYCGRCGLVLAAAQTPPAAPPPGQAQTGPTCVLVCVSGPDQGKQIVVGGQPVLLGTAAECAVVSTDPEAAPEAAEVAFQDGRFYFRTRSDRPLSVSGQPLSEGILPPGAPLLIGSSWWQATPPSFGQYGAPYGGYVPPNAAHAPRTGWMQGLNQRVGAVTGVGPVEGLNVKELFSEVFHKHNDEDVEEYFMTGTRSTTPPIESVAAVWPKPWVFFRIFALSLLVFVGFSVGVQHFHNLNCVPGLIVIGSFAIPLTIVVLYFEMNVPHNVSFYQVFRAILVGGILSLIVTLFWDGVIEGSLRLPLPGIIEEIGKASVLFLFVRNTNYRWTLNGLLLGGAIGAGFAGFESAGYALQALLGGSGDALGAVQQSIIMRGVLSPGGHVAWAALEGAALWKVKGDRPFTWAMVQDIRFLRVLGLSMVLHTVWDIQLFIPVPEIIFFPLLGVLSIVAWLAITSFIQDGLKQVQTAQGEREAARERAPATGAQALGIAATGATD